MSYNDPSATNETRLRAIMDSIGRVEQYAAGVTKADFLDNQEKIDAVCMRIDDIGENVSQLYKQGYFKNSPFDLPWKRMAGLRHLISHAYSKVNPKLIWAIAENDLAPLKKAIEWHLQDDAKGQSQKDSFTKEAKRSLMEFDSWIEANPVQPESAAETLEKVKKPRAKKKKK